MSLGAQLDRAFVARIKEYQASNAKKWDVTNIIIYFKSKESVLGRKPYKNLELSCERVLKVLREQMDSDSEFEYTENLVPVKDTNHMNRALSQSYKRPLEALEESKDPKEPKDDELPEVSALALVEKERKKKRLSSKKARLSNEEKWPAPNARLSDLAGIDDIVEDVMQLLGLPLKHPEIYQHLGIEPPRGILLFGSPGCGKTALANSVAGELNVPFINISAPSVVSGMSGESEKKIRDVFEEAKELAPCILFIDEIDAITPKRETAQREMERRIVAQLLTCMDECSLEKTGGKPVMIIGATNRPDSLDPALRRAGRFDREISMGVPDEEARSRILEKLSDKLNLAGDVDFKALAKLTPGYVGADLKALAAEAGMIAMSRIFTDLAKSSIENAMEMDSTVENAIVSQRIFSDFVGLNRSPLTEEELIHLAISFNDFERAIKVVQPSAQREGFAMMPNVTWADIGGLMGVRDELRMALVEPFKHPELFTAIGISSPMGVLLYGPPGTGKTMLAKAIANESHCNFISVKGPELLNKYVGESERAIRTVFSRAQQSSPCIIFFDELDAICPARSGDGDNQSSSRLVNTLLTEMDGMQSRKKVYVIAATNRPDMIDPAMLRPGRLDKTLYVDLPAREERLDILNTLVRKTPLAASVDLNQVSSLTDGFSGADLAALVREAAVSALRNTCYKHNQIIDTNEKPLLQIQMTDFSTALSKVNPSVSQKDRKRYDLLRVKFGTAVPSQ